MWEIVDGLTSAALAVEVTFPDARPEWRLQSSSVNVRPDGSHVLVTFWLAQHPVEPERNTLYRCVDYVTEGGEYAGSTCAVPRMDE